MKHIITITAAAALAAAVALSPPAAADNFIMCPSGTSGVLTNVTSCAFADNVARALHASGGPVVYAYSPVTGATYTMSCSGPIPTNFTNGAVVRGYQCNGGNNAGVVVW